MYCMNTYKSHGGEMKGFLAKTFGGISLQYYIRNFLFGSLFLVFTAYVMTHDGNIQDLMSDAVLLAVINTFLYPYARFAYETIIEYIVGDNVFIVNTLVLVVSKLITMLVCWSAAIFIAPVGLIYLFYRNQKVG